MYYAHTTWAKTVPLLFKWNEVYIRWTHSICMHAENGTKPNVQWENCSPVKISFAKKCEILPQNIFVWMKTKHVYVE